MAKYKLLIKPSAAKEISEIPKQDRQRVINRISRLADNPRCEGCEKLSGQERYRVRRGRYRILYTISDEEVIVVVVKVGHRRDVYR
ncbi:MAG: type II toxin-antitoxin system mRNA interferase toxin, RelE/StbE family [Acidobacteria bacterium]|nr:MAG: type II toxin-antitoxin system mRNA interferase toxin, RelE/StbE family [Acidobacteriota bacterium]